MISYPFCVIEKPYTIWDLDIRDKNLRFLKNVDTGIYYRTAHTLVRQMNDESSEEISEEQDRKDISSISRLIWHHGIETLTMLLGAYIQAPEAVYAYFLKCKTEEVVEIAQALSREEILKYTRLVDNKFTLYSLLNGIHKNTGWPDLDIFVTRFEQVLRNMLTDFTSPEHHLEYNCIKHGLRASHGQFGLSAGIEHVYGVAPPPEEMQMVGYSKDSSIFDIHIPLEHATKQQSKINFTTKKISVTWSLERTLMELQLISIILNNTVSSLRIFCGISAHDAPFNRIVDGEEFWNDYLSIPAAGINKASFSIITDARQLKLSTEREVFESYRRRSDIA